MRDKTVAVFGLGAIGGQIAMELARNGCGKLILVDHDIVEPGNSIRWPLGTTAWGRHKTESLREHLISEYPWTAIQPVSHHIGMPTTAGKGDRDVLLPIIAEADLIIDATASTGISRLIADFCQRDGKHLVSVFATASVEGGIVGVHHPQSGCPTCLQFAYYEERIQRAPGSGDMDGFRQPPGCAERTFSGSSYDLQELSTHAVRTSIDILKTPEKYSESLIFTLALHNGTSEILPFWSETKLPRIPECGCPS